MAKEIGVFRIFFFGTLGLPENACGRARAMKVFLGWCQKRFYYIPLNYSQLIPRSQWKAGMKEKFNFLLGIDYKQYSEIEQKCEIISASDVTT